MNSASAYSGQTVTVIGFGRRFVAYLIDSVLLTAFSCTFLFCVDFAIGMAVQDSQAGSSPTLQLFFNCLSLILSALYFAGFWTATGQTPGKMAMGIKVIKTDGRPVSFGAALIRWIGYLLGGIPLALGFIWIAFDSRRQGWHDKMAGTYVVPQDTEFLTGQPVNAVPSDSGGAAIGMVLLIFLGFVGLTIGIIFILLLLGPVVGDVFSNIVDELKRMPTPTP